MTKRLTETQIDNMTKKSREFETAWRAFCHPGDSSINQIEDASYTLTECRRNYRIAIENGYLPIADEALIKISMGLYHYPGFTIPQNLEVVAKRN